MVISCGENTHKRTETKAGQLGKTDEELEVEGGAARAAGERGGDPAQGEAGAPRSHCGGRGMRRGEDEGHEPELLQQGNGKGSWISLGGGVGG